MERKHDFLGGLLAVLTGLALLASMLVRAFLPRMILPELNSAAVVLLSLAALVADHYCLGSSKRDYRLLPAYAALVFGVLPWAASFLAPVDAVKLAVLGAVIFTACTFLFDAMLDRLSSGPAAKAAPVLSAFVLYLAAQCFMGIF